MSDETKPAFPVITGDAVFYGITLREYYAGLALTGYLASGVLAPPDNLAAKALDNADALIKALAASSGLNYMKGDL